MTPGDHDSTHLALQAAHPAARADWERAASGVLNRMGRTTSGVDPAQLLTRSTIDGLDVPALGVGTLDVADPGSEPYVRGTPARLDAGGWDVRSVLVDPDPRRAAVAAIDDLANGATSLWITVGGNGTRLDDLPVVLDEVYLDLAPVVLQAAGEVTAVQAAWALADLLPRVDDPHRATNLGADPIGRAIRSHAVPSLHELPEIAEVAMRSGVRAFTVDALVAHQQGAAEVGELGYSIAVGVAYLREITAAGVGIDNALALMEFRYSATADQFLTMSKFRAARQLWHRVAELSGAGRQARAQTQHGVTSMPMMTRYDPWTNLLRTTIATFAAGVGGADSITVLPFDVALGVPEHLGRRLARNISSVLTDEAHVAETADPVGGATAVEALTAELAAAGWAEFQRIEAAGGVGAALADGSMLRRWERTGSERRQRIGSRLQPITGISEFPDRGETLLIRQPFGSPQPPGWTVDFETMRDTPLSTTIFLATMGLAAQFTPRATFVRNTFAAGGLGTVDAGPTISVEELTARYDGSAVVCLAGTDEAYLDQGPATIWALRTAGARWIVLAGSPGPELAQLVDDSIAVGDDVIGFLERTRNVLSTQEKPR